MVVSVDNIFGFIFLIVYMWFTHRMDYATNRKLFWIKEIAAFLILAAAIIWGFPILVGLILLVLFTILYRSKSADTDQ